MIEYKVIIQYWHKGALRVKSSAFGTYNLAKGCLSCEKDSLGRNYVYGEIQKISNEIVFTSKNTFIASIRTNKGTFNHTFSCLDELFDYIKSVDDLVEFKVRTYARD